MSNPVAVIYTRVSTLKQAAFGISLEAQLDRCKQYCAMRGWEVIGTHEDAGLSGAGVTRPGLDAALNQTIASQGTIVFYSLSRFARSTIMLLETAEHLGRVGANFASVTDNIDTSNAAGMFMFRMLSSLAEFERDQISERTKGALLHRRESGYVVGSPLRLHRRVVENGKVTKREEVDPDQVNLAERVLHDHDEGGLSFAKIRDRLERNGELNARGKPYTTRSLERLVKDYRVMIEEGVL